MLSTFNCVASAETKTEGERRNIPSASTALVLGAVLGLLQTIFLVFLAKPLLSVMGVKSVRVLINFALAFHFHFPSVITLYPCCFIIGISYASPCTEVSHDTLTRGSSSSSVFSHARRFSRIQGY